MKLFPISDTAPLEKSQWAIETPLGNLIPNTQLGSHLLNLSNVANLIRLEKEGLAASWCYDEFIAECVICKSKIILPPEMHISDHWVVFWRVQAKEVIKPLKFAIQWEENYRWSSGGANSGWCLDAQTWDDGKIEISVGTEDSECLSARADRGDWLPNRYSKILDRYGDGRGIPTVEYRADSLAILLPDLRSAEKCQIHFIIAWAPYSEASVATWYAVEQSSQRLLKGSGFY